MGSQKSYKHGEHEVKISMSKEEEIVLGILLQQHFSKVIIRSGLLSQELWFSLPAASDFQKDVEIFPAFENIIGKSKKSVPV